MANSAADSVETVISEKAAVDCDGGGGALGHPRVFLHIKPDVGHIDCPYCGKRFELKAATTTDSE